METITINGIECNIGYVDDDFLKRKLSLKIGNIYIGKFYPEHLKDLWFMESIFTLLPNGLIKSTMFLNESLNEKKFVHFI